MKGVEHLAVLKEEVWKTCGRIEDIPLPPETENSDESRMLSRTDGPLPLLTRLYDKFHDCLEELFRTIMRCFEPSYALQYSKPVDLLHAMTQKIEGFPHPVLSMETVRIIEELDMLRRFRPSKFEVGYGLKQIRHMLTLYMKARKMVKKELSQFISSLEQFSDPYSP